MLKKSAIGTFVVFLLSVAWLFWAWSIGSRSYSWAAVPAEVTKNDALKSISGKAIGWRTTIQYAYEGQGYQAVLTDYLLGEIEVYVDPKDPTHVTAHRGPTFDMLARPLLLTIGSGLFAIVLGLIAVSPKEEDYD
ncbi:DUF3592 domain-containing protein [Lignipirellula cremea]|nr:DUF3592 domain-containing protein [Lignipirellula cremea]